MSQQYPDDEIAQQKKARDNREMFEAIAPRYDMLNNLLSFGLESRWRRRLIDLCQLQSGNDLLDLCCGTGDVTREAARRGATVIGLDASEAMLDVARKNSPAAITYLMGDALSLPFCDNSFDAVTIAFGNRNVVSLCRLYSEMTRVAKSGGRVVSLEITSPANPLLRALFFSYFRTIPPLAARLARVDVAAYQYLPASVAVYPASEAVSEIMRQAGLHDVTFEHHLAGAITIHSGCK